MIRRFLIVLALLGFTAAHAAVTTDPLGCANGSGVLTGVTTSLNLDGYTVSSGMTGSVLVAVIVNMNNGGPISGVTANWDNLGTPQPMAVIGSANNGGNAQVFFVGLRNPTPGNKRLAITWTGAAQVVGAVCALQGADVTSDATAFKNFTCNPSNCASGASSTSSQSVTVPSTVNDAVVAAFDGVTASIASVNNTQLYLNSGGSVFASAANTVAGSVNPTMTANFTGTFTTISAGLTIAAPAAGGVSCSGRLSLMGVGC